MQHRLKPGSSAEGARAFTPKTLVCIGINPRARSFTYRTRGRTGTGGKTAAVCRARPWPGGPGGRTAAPSGWRISTERLRSRGSSLLRSDVFKRLDC